MFYEHDLVVVVNNCILNLTTNRFIISSPLGEKKLFAIIRHHRYVPTISLRRMQTDDAECIFTLHHLYGFVLTV